MINPELISDYIKRARIRYKLLSEFMKEDDYADVVRVSQEIVELIEKAILIKIGINPPKWHDVIDIITENKDKISKEIYNEILKLKKGAKWLRSQREISFYGAADFIPSKDYTVDDAIMAIEIAQGFIKIIDDIVKH